MKKFISTLLVAACLFAAIPAQAQIRWGLKGGVNLTKPKLSGFGDNFKSDNTTGFFVGPMVEFTLPIVGLGVDGALLYSQRKAKIIETTTDRSDVLKQHSLEIPVNLKYSMGLGDLAGVFIAVGPSFGFNLKNDDFKSFIPLVTAPDDPGREAFKNDFKKANVSLNFGIGLKLINHIQLGVNYNLLLTESAKVDKTIDVAQLPDGKFKNNTWQISLAYLF